MDIISDPEAWRRWQKSTPRSLVFVPTMGALHAGHRALLNEARRRAGHQVPEHKAACGDNSPPPAPSSAGSVAVSIFVNPTQFGPGEDLARYPRTLDADLAMCREAGVDAVFVPEAGAIYAADASAWVEETTLSRGLCGRSRPGHFRGVCTVVAKLLLLTQPDVMLLGEKDWQQLAILRRMVRDLFFPVEIAAVPTVREPDGLAMSSRNRYLDPASRSQAPRIYAALREVAALAESGETSADALRSRLLGLLEAIPGARVDYAEIADAETLEPVSLLSQRPARAFVAVHLGGARLIDNIALPSPCGVDA